MSTPIADLFMGVGDERDAAKERLRALGFRLAGDVGGPSEILLAIGAEGGAVLARCIAERGLDSRVRGIGLVGVTAPWAEPSRVCGHLTYRSAPCDARLTLPLGPLESLRAVAERARRGQMCAHESCILSGQDCGERTYPFRFVVACAPDDAVCVACEGTGAHKGWLRPAPDCSACAGAGKALSSADVAKEVCGFEFDWPAMANWRTRTVGGVSVVSFLTAEHLIEHGLRAVVEGLTR